MTFLALLLGALILFLSFWIPERLKKRREKNREKKLAHDKATRSRRTRWCHARTFGRRRRKHKMGLTRR